MNYRKKLLCERKKTPWWNSCHAWKGVVVCLAAISLVTCSGGGRRENTSADKFAKPDCLTVPRHGGKLIIGVQQEPEMLSEILNAMAANNLICNLIFSKFVKYDDSLRLVPDLIEELPSKENGGISDDYLKYTYHLRKDARWHDGVPVTSRDVEFTYHVIMDPDVNVESREGWDVVDRIETPDEKTVVFHLKRAYPDFVGETFYDEPVLPEHLLRDHVGQAFHSSPYHHTPVGSGPFTFKEWIPGSHLIVVKNNDYYRDGPYLDEIIIKFIPDMNALLVQLKTGEIDLFDNADINFLKQLERISGVRVYKTPMLMYEHLDLNNDHPILSDKKVRQAIAFATNKREIAEKIYNGVVEIAKLDEFPSSKYYSETAAEKTGFNPLRARQLLRDAGWLDNDGDGILEKGGEKLSLTISTTSGQVNRERTEVLLIQQYKQVGIELRVRNYNSTVLYGTYEDGGILKQGKFDIAMYAWLSSPEPATKEAIYSEKNIPPKGQNNPRIRNAELTSLLARASNETEEVERIRLYQTISDILVEEAPVVPLFWYTNLDAGSERLKNFRPNPTQSSDSWNAHEWYLTE